MKTYLELQTISVAFEEIRTGVDPWLALGNFMNDFFGNYPERRDQLVADPLQTPEDVEHETWRWAVFCAASVEYLCQKYAIPCPEWANDPRYTLTEPWFNSPGAHKTTVREKLMLKTPPQFTRRNIYCGNRMFLNKYEATTELLQRRSA